MGSWEHKEKEREGKNYSTILQSQIKKLIL